MKYAEKDDIRKQIEESIKIMTPISDENQFFDTLDREYIRKKNDYIEFFHNYFFNELKSSLSSYSSSSQ